MKVDLSKHTAALEGSDLLFDDLDKAVEAAGKELETQSRKDAYLLSLANAAEEISREHHTLALWPQKDATQLLALLASGEIHKAREKAREVVDAAKALEEFASTLRHIGAKTLNYIPRELGQ